MDIEREIDWALAVGGMRDLSSERRLMLGAFLAEVLLWGDRIHLVGRARRKENLRTQLLDSILLLEAAEKAVPGLFSTPGTKLADIGSGAGFPGVVWKIARPEIEIALFERREKLHAFLERAISLLGITGMRAYAGDAQAFSEAGSFGVAVSKAAGRLRKLLPLAARMLVPGGLYVTIKGSSWQRELDHAGIRHGMEIAGAASLPRARGVALFFRKRAGL